VTGCQTRHARVFGQLLGRDPLPEGEGVPREVVAVAERIVHRRLEPAIDTERDPLDHTMMRYCGATNIIALQEAGASHQT
jgi:hypothetical protein